uniref:SFRICE_025177 n=1 Tax=Spodoptera frugiperda TaxID=7108 RepID=A0A2H1V8G6_SPOFR
MQCHTFYPRRGRQRCTLRHVMPLYNVHPLFTICVISPITNFRATGAKMWTDKQSLTDRATYTC